MANVKISALSSVTAPATTDVVPIVNAGVTKKVTIADFIKAGDVAKWARVYHNAAQSAASGAVLVLAFNSEYADTDTIHDTATNNSRLTCKTAGVYLICGTCVFDLNATGIRTILIRLNGTTFLSVINQTAISGQDTQMVISTAWALAVNDYVELIVSQSSGVALDVSRQPNYSPEFSMVRLGA